MKAADGNGHTHKYICDETVVDKIPEGPYLTICGTPILAHNFAERLPENKLPPYRCRSCLMSKLHTKKPKETKPLTMP